MTVFGGQLLLFITILSTIGLFILLYYRNTENISNRFFMSTLVLVVAYLFSHGIHFLFMVGDDVTVLDQSCHFFLLAIMLSLTFFSYYFNSKEKMPPLIKGFLIIPTFTLFGMLWNGDIIEGSHKHGHKFVAQYSEYYIIYIVWYAVLLGINIFWLLIKYNLTNESEKKQQILYLLIGLILTNSISFIVGVVLPWILGFYYLVEISPMAFLSGLILFTTVAINRFNLFPRTIDRLHTFSLNKKVLFTALIIIPIVIIIQLPIGRAIISFPNSEEWIKFAALSLFSGILISLSMAYIISRIIANPINVLKSKTEEIENGRYGTKAGLSSDDEIGQLARSFDRMSDTLLKNQSQLLENSGRINSLLNAFERANVLMVIIDEENVIIESNSFFSTKFHQSKSEFLDDDSFISPDGSNIPFSLNSLKIKARFQNINDLEVVIKNQRDIVILMSVSSIQLPELNSYIYLLVGVDITEKKKLQKDLAQAEKMAALGNMAAVMAHEIKTPLTSIKMNCDILFEELGKEENEESFKIINKETNRINNLIKEVLEFSREIKLDITKFRINDLLQEVISNFKSREETKAFLVNENIEDFELYADRERIYRVLMNIINNAREAMHLKGEFNIMSYEEENTFVLELSDNGPGVDEKQKEQIFEPFYTTKTSGTGLGLSISKKIIEAHKGSLVLMTRPNGATFKIRLPKN